MTAPSRQVNPRPQRIEQVVRVPSIYSHNRRVVTRQEIDGRTVFVANEPSLRDAAQGATAEEQLAARGQEGDPLALIYGRGPHAGTVFFRRVDSTSPGSAYGALVLGIIWGMGPVEAFNRIQYADGKDLDPGIIVENYRGDPADGNYNTVDSTILAVEPTYADTLVGIDEETGLAYAAAYSVLRIPARLWNQGIQEFQAWISGHPVYDPRDGTQTFGVFSSYKYNPNAALIHADLYTHPLRGMGKTIDWTTVEAPATSCEGARSREIHTRFGRLQPAASLLEVVGDYASTTIVFDGSSAKMVELKDEVPIATITRDDTVGGFSISQRGGREAPDIVEVEYSADDLSTSYRRVTRKVRAKRAGLTGDAHPYVIDRVRMPAFIDEDPAYQYAVRRLNMLRSDIEVAWRGRDSALEYTRGDVVQITDGNGLTNFRVRISDVTFEQPGRYRVEAVEDSAAMYSSAPAPDVPTVPPDWNAISPLQPQLPNNVAIATTAFYFEFEESRQKYVAAIEWDATEWPYAHSYRLRFYETISGIDLINRIESHVEGREYRYITPALDKSKGYTLSVTTIGPYNESAESTDTTTTPVYAITLQPPKNVAAEQVSADVRIMWEAQDPNTAPPVSTANDVDHYEVRRGTQSQTVADWATLTPIADNVTDLYALDLKASGGDWRYFVRAMSWTGDLSPAAGTVDITVVGVSTNNLLWVGHFPSWSEGTLNVLDFPRYYADLFYFSRSGTFNCRCEIQGPRGANIGFDACSMSRQLNDTSTQPLFCSYSFETTEVAGLRGKQITVDIYIRTTSGFSGSNNTRLVLRTCSDVEGNFNELGAGNFSDQFLIMNGIDLPALPSGFNNWIRMTGAFANPVPDDAIGMSVAVRHDPSGTSDGTDGFVMTEWQVFEGGYYSSLSADPKRQAPPYAAEQASIVANRIARLLRYDESAGQAAQLAHVMRVTPTQGSGGPPYKYDARL